MRYFRRAWNHASTWAEVNRPRLWTGSSRPARGVFEFLKCCTMRRVTLFCERSRLSDSSRATTYLGLQLPLHNHDSSQEPLLGIFLSFKNVSYILKVNKMPSYRRDRAAGCISFREKWKTGTGRQYFTDIIGLSPLWHAKLSNSVENAKWGLLHRSRSFKVIAVGANRKPICDFLLVINSN